MYHVELHDESVRFSWSFWLAAVAPCLFIWGQVLRGHVVGLFSGANLLGISCGMYIGLWFLHLFRVHASQVDPTNDTWFLFGLNFVSLKSPIVCLFHLAVSVSVRESFLFCRGLLLARQTASHHSADQQVCTLSFTGEMTSD